MQCSQESLQMYLDGELDRQTRKSVEEHLGQCRACRQEIAHLQLLWLELEQPDEIEIPAALPYLRQQIVNQAIKSRQNNQNNQGSFWDAQKLAWQPAIMGASYLPGLNLLSTVSRVTSSRLKSGTIALVRRLVMPSQKG